MVPDDNGDQENAMKNVAGEKIPLQASKKAKQSKKAIKDSKRSKEATRKSNGKKNSSSHPK